MSVATEISRLQQAKADLKTAIEAKGVTVPLSALLDDYPDLVDSIPTGSILTPTAGDYPVVENAAFGGAGSSLTSTGISITIPVTGTYRLKWSAFRRSTGTSYTWSSRLYRTRSGSTSAIGTEISSWTSTYRQENSLDVACNAGDVITVYAAGRSSSYTWAGNISACVAQKLWTN